MKKFKKKVKKLRAPFPRRELNEKISTQTESKSVESTIESVEMPVQIWPGALTSLDKLIVPIKSRDKMNTSNIDYVEFPDTILDGFQVKEGSAFLASIRGDMKRHTGGLRQDSALVHLVSYDDGSRFVFLVLADGVGSKKMSHLASREVVISSLDSARLISAPNRDNWHQSAEFIMNNAVEAIKNLGKTHSILTSDLLTTLTFAFISLDDPSRQKVYLGSVGNCRALGVVNNQIIELEKNNESTELVASAKTKALPINLSDSQISVIDLPKDAICCILSDGAVEVVNQGIDFVSLVKTVALDIHMLGWAIDVRAAGRTDDRTVVLWRPW